jgi:hypothetical protein
MAVTVEGFALFIRLAFQGCAGLLCSSSPIATSLPYTDLIMLVDQDSEVPMDAGTLAKTGSYCSLGEYRPHVIFAEVKQI